MEPSLSTQTDELIRKLERMKNIEKRISQLEKKAREARLSGIKDPNKYDSITANCGEAKTLLDSGDARNAEDKLVKAEDELSDLLIAQKNSWGLPNWGYLQYFISTRGALPIVFAVMLFFLFGFLLSRYTNLPVGKPLAIIHFLGIALELPSEILTIPLWSAFFGGVGAAVQILMGVAADMQEDGIVSEYKRIWYLLLPMVALVFGYLAYILIDLGFGGTYGGQSASFAASNISLVKVTGANSISWINNGTGNYSFTAKTVANLAATNMDSFTISVGTLSRILACFLAGYATEDFIKKLSSVSRK